MFNEIQSLLKTIGHAKTIQLIEYERVRSNGLTCDNIDEHLHYASPVNGNINIVIPGKLIVLPEPALLPDGALWEDTQSDLGTTRAFSARYYAELLVHLDVRLVATRTRGGSNDRADAAAAAAATEFEAAGLACEDGLLPAAGGGGGALLWAHDRLLTLIRTAPGAVTLQCARRILSSRN